MALITAHEFGHVIGLDHEDNVCATMNTVMYVNHPEHCAAPPNGMWVCRLLRADDVRGAVNLYGGVVRPLCGPGVCPRRGGPRAGGGWWHLPPPPPPPLRGGRRAAGFPPPPPG